MIMKPVSSSNIALIGYDALSQTLRVQFHSGGIYEYPDIPTTLYNGLMNAQSHGSYFAEYIKHRRFRKIR